MYPLRFPYGAHPSENTGMRDEGLLNRPPNSEEKAREVQCDLEPLSAGWKREHKKRVEELYNELDVPEAGGAEKMLNRLASQDLARLQELEGTEIVVLRQLGMFVEAGSHKHIAALATVMTDLSKFRSE